VRLLSYFGEASAPCGNCDNCLSPPAIWDATEASRKALSGVYRFARQRGQRFGAGHLIDVLRGKVTDKVTQFGHESLSTFGIGADLSEARWRAVLRQLIALGHLQTEGEFNTLELAPSARAVLKGEVKLELREPSERVRGRRGRGAGRPSAAESSLDAKALARFTRLKAWRAGIAREHGVPAYVVFHDATLAEMARRQPGSLGELAQVSGVGTKKLESYGREILRVLDGS
jgi:ATP-dependent DNA helicase RecQ